MGRDRGPYLDLSSRVRIGAPGWLDNAPAEFVVDASSGFCFRYVEGVAVEICQSRQAPTMRISGLGDDDLDGDGIPTALDILIGAKKTALLATPYVETYRALDYPNGDMPRQEGVCTDVVIRALRNAGYDLQLLVSNDRATAPNAYPAIAKPDRNIDHRRVRNLLVYFQRHFEALSPLSTLLPGDVIFFDTMGDSRPEHIGVVSNQVGKSGRPLIINSWTTGYVTSEMDLLPTVLATHRFRVKTPALDLAEAERGLDGWLARQRLVLDKKHRQLVVVLAPDWSSSVATLYRYERQNDDIYARVASPVMVRLGVNGLASGRGITTAQLSRPSELPEKVEGDMRTPLGVFELGTAFGSKPLSLSSWPFRVTSERDHWVDDPASALYNTWYTSLNPNEQLPFDSSEDLHSYEFAIVLRHNDAPIRKGAGSAHFIHSGTLEHGSHGCTVVPGSEMVQLLKWLEPNQHPLIVQTAGHIYD
jgi:uncharacterized protein YijF (DUF1287 family)/L,D-peptidoglycan transpeptidase YkuD (ErfK/YbiS/YcfS/YnhG family)